MLQKDCPKCESRAGLNIMKGEVTQLMDAATKTPMITNWTCGYCGFTDQDTTYMGSMGGCQNVKSIVGVIDEDTVLQTAKPVSSPKSTRMSKPTPTPVVEKVVETPTDDIKE